MIRSASPLDLAVGMEYYSRPEVYLGRAAEASLTPETFKVYEEVAGLGVARPPGDGGGLEFRCSPGERVLAVLCKRGLSTLLASWVLRRRGVEISYWGIKDAEAESCQFVVARCVSDISLSQSREGRLLLVPLGRAAEGFSPRRHHLLGNLFEVVLSHSEADPRNLADSVRLSARFRYLNYFGYQRFGTVRPVSHLVGRAIASGEYAEALDTLVGRPSDLESPRVREARELFAEGRIREALERFPRSFVLERSVLREYIRTGDPGKAIRRGLPPGMLRFFVEAYQSYLFNRALSSLAEALGAVEEVGSRCEVLELPRPGLSGSGCGRFSAEALADDVEPGKAMNAGLFVKAVRETTFAPEDLVVSSIAEGLLLVSFRLRRGVYATVYLRELLRENLRVGPPADPGLGPGGSEYFSSGSSYYSDDEWRWL